MLPQLELDRGAAPLHEQLSAELRRLILTGQLQPGERLPATRGLARDLGVSRNVVVLAYEALQLEGYLEARVGSGTRVPPSLPAHLLRPAEASPRVSASATALSAPLSHRGDRLAEAGRDLIQYGIPPRPFRPGAVDPDLFPARLWGRIAGRIWRRDTAGLLSYGDPAGYPPLREAIARHVGRHRAVRCDAQQVLITHGSQQALDLLGRLLLDPGDGVAVENPGYPAAWAAFRGAGTRLVPMPVDAEGVRPAPDGAAAGGVRLFYTTPSHQYPLGVTMSLERRLRLLDWARRREVWIVEDDYDSEFRYESRPLPALQGLDRHGRVIYVGTFSKVLAPGLRLGYLILPIPLVEAFRRARTAMDYHPQLSLQANLAEFIAAGHLERHIAKLRRVYGERWRLLGELLAELPADRLEIVPGAAGLHLTLLLDGGIDDRQVAERALRAGIEAPPLSMHSLTPRDHSGLILGFGTVAVDVLRSAVGRLAGAISAETGAIGERVR